MDKEIIDKQIKNEIELFKVYAFFLVGLITAIINFVIRYIEKNEKFILILLEVGSVFLILVSFFIIVSYIKIIKLTKKLKR